jgi:hypothetical protein
MPLANGCSDLMTSLLSLSTAFSECDSCGGRRAAVAGLASGSGFSIAGVVGVEVLTSVSLLGVGLAAGVGVGSEVVVSSPSAGWKVPFVVGAGCDSLFSGGVVLGSSTTGCGLSAGLGVATGAGGWVTGGCVAGLSSGSTATGVWMIGACTGGSIGCGATTGADCSGRCRRAA